MKKSYQEIKDSPALSYISQMQSQSEEAAVNMTTDDPLPEPVAPVAPIESVESPEPAAPIESATPIEPEESLEEILQKAHGIEVPATPAGYRINAQYRELKTQRTQLVFPPTLFRKVKKRAKKLNLSMNEFVCLVLQAVVGNDPEN